MKRLLFIYLCLAHSIVNGKPNDYNGTENVSSRIISLFQATIPPHFPGGEKAFGKFLSENLKWPLHGDIDIQGRVIISFTIEKDGGLTGFKVEKKLWPELDAEALRVIKKSPKWVPATRNGKPVSVKYHVPINFTLGE